MESPPPVPPVQKFQHEPKVAKKIINLSTHVTHQENLENQNAEVRLSDVEKKGLVGLLILNSTKLF